MVWCGSWCIVWSVVGILDSSDCLIWCDGLIWGGSYGLRLLSGLTAEIKIKKMRSWGNSSEKALNALGSYVKKKRRKNTEILYFSNSVAIENFLCPEKVCKDFIILIQGCADDLFESFPFVAKPAMFISMVTIEARPQYICARDRAWCSDVIWGGNQVLTAIVLVGFYQGNRPFAASHSRGTKPQCWRAKVALG